MAATFANPVPSVNPTPVGGGLKITVIAASFSQNQASLLIQAPCYNVATAQLTPLTTNDTDGAGGSGDKFLLTNTINASGYINLLANSTTAFDALHPQTLKWTRNGTNNQDCTIIIHSKA